MTESVSAGSLKDGDEIRVIAISESIDTLHVNLIRRSIERLLKLGLTATFTDHAFVKGVNISSHILNKVKELHMAFADPKVKVILIGLGGINAIEMIPYIDFDLIRRYPKPICGFSDATVILNAIYAKTSLVTYYGPMLFTFGSDIEPEYTADYFKKAILMKSPYELIASRIWGNYNELRSDIVNGGYQVVRNGNAEGLLVGGHVPSLNLLQGTDYLPGLDSNVLFLEICERYGRDTLGKLNQYLNALMLQKDAAALKGLLIGRLFRDDGVGAEDIGELLLSRQDLKHIPIITNVDFGHTAPMITLPIGGKINIMNGRMIISGQ